MVRKALVGVAGLIFTTGCPSDDTDSTGDVGSTTTFDDGTTGDEDSGGGEMLGCPEGETCRLVIVAQTLDDRVEVFSPDDPSGAVYRGAIDLDLVPNTCDGCQPGDNGGERLDEPFGLARAGGHLHVIAGHFPTRELGTLLSFPLPFFEGRAAGDLVGVSEFHAGGESFSGITSVPLQQLEPIYLSARGSKLLVGTFANDLFAAESSWTTPGKLLILDAAEPDAGMGVVDLGALTGGACNAAGEVVELDDDRIAVACDGNDAVAILDVGELETLAPSEAAAAITGSICGIPGATGEHRVRHLAPDGAGGFVLAEGPTPLDVLAPARLWRFSGECQAPAVTMLATDGDWQLGNIEKLPGADAWVFASGSATPVGHRGVYVAHGAGGELTICEPLAGVTPHLVDETGAPLEPLTVAVTADGTHLAVGVGPFSPAQDAPGYGKVLWATLSGADDPCGITATVVDLTDGAHGASAVDPADPKTWRRAPSVIEIAEL